MLRFHFILIIFFQTILCFVNYHNKIKNIFQFIKIDNRRLFNRLNIRQKKQDLKIQNSIRIIYDNQNKNKNKNIRIRIIIENDFSLFK